MGSISLPGTMQRDLEARDGNVYRLLVALPAQPAPSSGFPVIVLVDGHALFATAVSAARLQAGRPEVTGIGPAVVVGIGYPSEAPFEIDLRQRDLLPQPGGAERFLDIVAKDVLPLIGQIAPVDLARCSLAGHSYGGLFALYALFSRPGLFAAHIAGSPSIWWSDRAILRFEERFRAITSPPAGRLLITVGGAERAEDARGDARRTERLAMARMVENATEMAGRLAESGRVSCESVVFPGENHVSVVPAMLSRAVAFALADTAQQRIAAA